MIKQRSKHDFAAKARDRLRCCRPITTNPAAGGPGASGLCRVVCPDQRGRASVAHRSIETSRGKFKHCLDLLPGHVELLHDFFNCHPIFKVFENRGHGKTGAAKDHAPPTFPGILSTAGHFDQSNTAMASPCFILVGLSFFATKESACAVPLGSHRGIAQNDGRLNPKANCQLLIASCCLTPTYICTQSRVPGTCFLKNIFTAIGLPRCAWD
jgi:hypothetical protein